MGMKPRKKPTAAVWLVRSSGGNSRVEVYQQRPELALLSNGNYWHGESFVDSFCPDDFQEITGFLPPTDEAIRVRFSVTKLENRRESS
ncbi:hypothetical protein LCGC14_2049410 [marine sediment metagenome]|uniref:Uncharacterized protein n=1 Tax=marine sediment metagenome TaxID=412755 RepID=A0A0F9HLF6_9ZZZZ